MIQPYVTVPAGPPHHDLVDFRAMSSVLLRERVSLKPRPQHVGHQEQRVGHYLLSIFGKVRSLFIEETTSASGPNGNIYWLNCGITDEDDTEDSKGWNPPNVTIGELVYLDLQDVITQPNNIYQLCASYVPLFEKYGKMYGIPPILMAAFAMQESSCNPDAVGEGGEQGLMQISKDKCGGAPDDNCRDPVSIVEL